MSSTQKYSIATNLAALVASSGGDPSTMMQQLGISSTLPEAERASLEEKLQAVGGGDRVAIENLTREIGASWRALLTTTPPGGVSGFETHWWGYQLSISHAALEKIDAGMEWVDAVAFVASACGAPLEVVDLILGILSIDLLLLSTVVDRGNGVVMNYCWALPAGPVLPLPQ